VSAVVWTNVFQALMFLVAGAVTLVFAVSQVDGGAAAVAQLAEAAGRLRIVEWGPAPGAPDFWTRLASNPNIVWVAVLNGFVGSMAAFGTDHDLMQRLLTVETRRDSQRTLALTPFATLLTLAIYLSLGAALFAYYAQRGAPALGRNDEVLPYFVAHAMPGLLRGLMLSAIVLASIDSPLGSLSASFVTDIYRPLVARGRSEAHYLRVSRVCVVIFGVILGIIAWAFLGWRQQILWLVFKIAGVPFGSLLGVFLLGLLSGRRVPDVANVLAMVTMTLVNLALLFLAETGRITFPWSWLVIVGTAGTIALSLGLTRLLSGRQG
jgi:Na+/proline symporter